MPPGLLVSWLVGSSLSRRSTPVELKQEDVNDGSQRPNGRTRSIYRFTDEDDAGRRSARIHLRDPEVYLRVLAGQIGVLLLTAGTFQLSQVKRVD